MKEKFAAWINWLKIFVLLFAMTMGFFWVYAFIWHTVGLPLTDLALLLLLAIAGLTEYGYYRWIRGD